MKTIASLTYVVEASLSALRGYSERLDALDLGEREVPALLKAITTEADVLSSALTRLSQHVSKVPSETLPKTAPRSGYWLEQANMFIAGVENGVCRSCGGVKQTGLACALRPVRALAQSAKALTPETHRSDTMLANLNLLLAHRPPDKGKS